MDNKSKSLKIFFTTDIHGYFFPTDYKSHDNKNMGLFSIANNIYINQENTLLIDGGDMLQGSPFVQYIEKDNKNYSCIAHIMNQIGYNFVSLGNHDFNFGYQALKSYTNNLSAQVLCCNLKDKKNELQFSSHTIMTTKDGLKVGIIGAVTEYVNIWESEENLKNLEILPAFECIKKTHDEIKGICDVLICVYHGGFEHDLEMLDSFKSKYIGENIGLAVCKELDFDLVLTCHQHMQVKGKNIFNTHTLQLPSNGTWYADIDITYTENKGVQIHSTNKCTDSKNPYTELEDKYKDLQDKVQVWLDKPVGSLSESITETNPLILMEKGWRFADLCNSIILKHTKADISCISLMNDPYPLTKTITIRDIVSSYPFSNTITTIEITGKDIKNALEQVASFFIVSNEKLSINPKYTKQKLELYNFDFYYGIEYSFDVKKEIGQRVILLEKNGISIDMDKYYTVSISGYRASGAGGYEMFPRCKVVKVSSWEVQEILIEEITKAKKIILPNKTMYSVLY